jgi:hypothetical protein
VQQCLFAKIGTPLQRPDELLPSGGIGLYHIDAATTDYVEFVTWIALTNDDGPSSVEFLSIINC